MSSPSSLLRKYGIRPLKRLGQCFLCDRNIMEKIIRIADVRDTDTIVEIGAGTGVLTAMIAEPGPTRHRPGGGSTCSWSCSEKSSGIAAMSKSFTPTFSGSTSRRFDPCGRQAAREQRLKVIGNVPYNISSQILLRLLEYRHCIGRTRPHASARGCREACGLPGHEGLRPAVRLRCPLHGADPGEQGAGQLFPPPSRRGVQDHPPGCPGRASLQGRQY